MIFKGTSAKSVVLNDFQIAIKRIKFYKEEGDSTEVRFEGPYEIDIIDSVNYLTQAIGDQEIEPGIYNKIRMEFHKSTDLDSNHVLFDRSVYMSGTIDGDPFTMWHDTSENFDIESTDGIEVTEGNSTNLVVDFMFSNLLDGIDMTEATDENGNGVIEIDPDDTDENGDIADSLKDNIKSIADMIKI